jgi:glycosyltransferase involved in cell wall biosynthesis
MTVHIKHLKVLFENKYDLVYGNTHSGTFCSILGKLKGTPLIFDMHGGTVEEFLLINQSNPGWWHSSALKWYFRSKFMNFTDLRYSDKIICVSNKMIKYLHKENGIPLEKMAYVTNGVDLEFFKPGNNERIQIFRKKLGLEDKFVFGYIGGLQKWQGVENFIEAAKKSSDSRLAFAIIGGENGLRKKNLLFIPEIPRSQISNYYAICNVLVLPRPRHPATEIAAPTKFSEYTAMGKPVLTTNVGDAANLVKKYNNGLVIEDNSINNLMEGILQLKNRSEDELEVMGENSRELAKNEFDWNKIAGNLLKVIESVN